MWRLEIVGVASERPWPLAALLSALVEPDGDSLLLGLVLQGAAQSQDALLPAPGGGWRPG